MDKPSVYVETTIPSIYFEQRTTPEMVARREATRRWWAVAHDFFDLLTGSPVILELRAGPVDRRSAWLDLLRDVPVLLVSPEVAGIATVYLDHKLMPERGEDALHLALASFYRCDYPVTWDRAHLANPRKSEHIREINQSLGLSVPLIQTPMQILGRYR